MSDQPDQPTGQLPAAAPARPLLRRHLALVITTACVITAGAYGFAALQQPTYTAHATVLVEPYTLPTAANPAPDLGTEQAIAVSGVVLGNAARALHTSVSTVTAAANVSVSTVANILDFGYSASTGAAAARGSTALAAAYMAYRVLTGTTGSTVQTNPTQTLATPQIRTRLISPAGVPGSPSSPDLVIDLIAGLVVGTIVGIGLALLADRFGQRLRTTMRWQEATGVPVLAGLEQDSLIDGSQLDGAHAVHAANGTGTVLRYLRARAGQLMPRTGGVLLVTSVQPQPERAALARSLADGLARAGWTATLLELTPDSAEQSTPAAGDGTGHTDGAAPGRTVALQLRESTTTQRGGALRPAGEWRPIRLDRLLARIDRARTENEVVVVTGPPVPASIATLDVAGVADLAIVVDDLGSARRDPARQVVAELRAAGCPVGGAVLIGLPAARTGVAVAPPAATPSATAEPLPPAARPAAARARVAPLLAWSDFDNDDQRRKSYPHVNGSPT
ncbi:MAG TPA: hypothetical protein VIG48_03810 [Jatrophihabitans sp.]|jgi:capsular polysaccharide biosynthesis protein